MGVWQQAVVLLAGVAAGTINTMVGSGTLITFPALLAVGLPPVSANMSNNIGLVFGGLAGTWGYRRELAGRGALLRRLTPISLVGGVTGAVLLLALPPGAFAAVVPVLITASLVLVLVQPRLGAAVARRAPRPGRGGSDSGGSGRSGSGDRNPAGAGGTGPGVRAGVLAAGVYGGYFGAAQGVLLVGLLGVFLRVDLQTVNAVKNALVWVVNTTAAVVFLAFRPAAVSWSAVLLVAVGSVIGGLIGAAVGRRLRPAVLRAVVVGVGVVAVVRMLG
jgi:uncharacterized protein